MAIKGLGYVIVQTGKGDAWHRFMTEVVGAMAAGDQNPSAADYRIDERPFRFRIIAGEEESLVAAAYEVDSPAALEELAERIRSAGQPVRWGGETEAGDRHVEAVFATSDPAGNGLEFYTGEAMASEPFVSPAGVSGFVTGQYGLGHAVFAAPDFPAVHGFYKAIGFRDTDLPHFKFSPDPDDPGMRFAFMHADGGRHHSVAIGEMPRAPVGCVHLMLEMRSIEDVESCHERMRAAGVPESASMGRHMNDQTLGFYMQTPSGFDLEIGCDSLVIDPAAWQTTSHTRPSEWGHVWAWQRAVEEAAPSGSAG